MVKVANRRGSFRLLCVDDDTLNLQLRCKILEGTGYTVSFSSDPVAACSFPVWEYDLIIVDFDMPNLNGYELLLTLRRQGACCPMMLLSGGLDRVPEEARVFFATCFAKGQRVPIFLEEVRRLLGVGSDDQRDC